MLSLGSMKKPSHALNAILMLILFRASLEIYGARNVLLFVQAVTLKLSALAVFRERSWMRESVLFRLIASCNGLISQLVRLLVEVVHF